MKRENGSTPAIGNVIASGIDANGHPIGSIYTIPAHVPEATPNETPIKTTEGTKTTGAAIPLRTFGESILTKRIAELKSEFTAGQNMLGDLESKKAELTNTLLRISGAIQVLEEMLTMYPKEDADNGT